MHYVVLNCATMIININNSVDKTLLFNKRAYSKIIYNKHVYTTMACIFDEITDIY